MYQFTTPTLTIGFPAEQLPVGDISSLVVTIVQGNNRLELTLADVTLDTETNSIGVSLSQEQTGQFEKGFIRLQVHIKAGTAAYCTDVKQLMVNENIHGKVIG